jgi:hypothetical protein
MCRDISGHLSIARGNALHEGIVSALDMTRHVCDLALYVSRQVSP